MRTGEGVFWGDFLKRGFGAAALMWLVAGCSALPATIPGLPQSLRAEIPPCPNVRILEPASRVTKYLSGQGRDMTDIILIAKITDFQGECETRDVDDRTQVVNMDLTVVFQADMGPANRSLTGEFSYFVAVVDAADRILAKEVFPVTAAFELGRNRVFVQDLAYQAIELLAGETAADYDILLGLQLTSDELTQNRELGGN